jgi:hypothetical protein
MSAEFQGPRGLACEITIGRLRRRIAKLTQQRDRWKSEYDSLSAFFKIYPYIDRHREDHVQRQKNRERLRELEATQAVLVRELERYKASDI